MDEASRLLARWLDEIGLTGDPEMARTAERVTELMRGFTAGEVRPPSTFPALGSGPVVLRDVPYHSLCAHHLLPFFGLASVAYAPADRIAGFSGIARVIAGYARRPQLQECLAEEIASSLYEAVQPRGVVVRLTARQLCMEMRGAQAAGEAVVLATRGDATGLLELLGG